MITAFGSISLGSVYQFLAHVIRPAFVSLEICFQKIGEKENFQHCKHNKKFDKH